MVTQYYILCGLTMFSIGIIGMLLHRDNLLRILISSEVMLLGINLCFVFFAREHGNVIGQVFTIFVIACSGAEVAVALIIFVLYYKEKGNLDTMQANEVKEEG